MEALVVTLNKEQTNQIELDNKEKLIYNLFFSDETIFHIDLNIFCAYDTRAKFREEIRTILKRGKLTIIDDRHYNTENTVLWKIEIRR